MGSSVIKKLLVEDSAKYRKLKEKNKIDYSDFIYLRDLNEKYDIPVDEYFNFFMHISNAEYNESILFDLIRKVYVGFLEKNYNKKIIPEYYNQMLGGINVYPKGSFIRKHVDTGVGADRIFTTLFFLNDDRKHEDGSILKIYTKDDVIDVIPNYQKFVVLEHQNFNYVHEVTKNVCENVRYTVYNPFSINDLNTKFYN